MIQREAPNPRYKLELAPDHFHPAYVEQTKCRTTPAPSTRSPSQAGDAASGPGAVARARIVVRDGVAASHQAFKLASSHAVRAARWSGQCSAALVNKVRHALTAPGPSRVDILTELAEAGRSCAVSNRLGALTVLTGREEISVRYNTPDRRIHQTGSEIAIEGDAALSPMFIASGWACRTRLARNRRRQIIGFLLPGDPIGLHGAHTSLNHTSIFALTAVETVDGSDVMEMAADQSQYPGVRNALERLHLQDEEFLVNQIARLANPLREERVAHLLLELQWRLQQARLASHSEFPMPLSDGEIGDALAIGSKAARNILNSFQRQNILRYRYGRAEVLRRDHLHNMSGFCPPLPGRPLTASGRLPASVADKS